MVRTLLRLPVPPMLILISRAYRHGFHTLHDPWRHDPSAASGLAFD